LLEWASEMALSPEFRTGQARLLILLGEVHLLAGRTAEAARFAERGLARSRQFRQRGEEAHALRLLGEIASRREPSDVGQADDRYREGLALAGELEMRPLACHCHLGLGQLYRSTGDRPRSREHLSAASTGYRAMDMQFWLRKAETELAL
jgi:hypothetical protein